MLPIINLFHFFIIAPLLLYIGYCQNYCINKPDKIVYDILVVLAISVFIFHGYRIFQKWE